MRSLGAAIAVVGLVACGSSPSGGDDPDAAGAPDGTAAVDARAIVDLDGDGLDDAYELEVAKAYLPFVSLDPADGCSRSGIVVRVRKHPADATKLLVIYDHLFEKDCGFGGHVGDDEVFGVAIDPAVPAPGGILAIKAASHQNTVCERISECTTCSGDARPQCDRAADGGAMWPVIYASKSKHGQYATKAQCPLIGTCLDQCTLATAAHRPPIANAGEPGKALISNLTTEGFINAANGWTEAAVMNVDPWAPGDFGGAGSIAGDLIDPVFETAPCS
jgi:hypothetical protein